jgi:hypothetical protein
MMSLSQQANMCFLPCFFPSNHHLNNTRKRIETNERTNTNANAKKPAMPLKKRGFFSRFFRRRKNLNEQHNAVIHESQSLPEVDIRDALVASEMDGVDYSGNDNAGAAPAPVNDDDAGDEVWEEIDEYLGNIHFLSTWEQKSGVPRSYIAAGLVAFVALVSLRFFGLGLVM